MAPFIASSSRLLAVVQTYRYARGTFHYVRSQIQDEVASSHCLGRLPPWSSGLIERHLLAAQPNLGDITLGIIWTILIGFVVGLLAKMLTPGRDPAGFFITAAIGIAGSLLATFGGQALGLYRAGEPAGFVGSLIGAIILLAIYHLVRRSSTT